MPLHLLSKKSWNVYNQDNIARVKRDEAQAAARAAEEEEAQQAADARRRMKALRGEAPSPTPSPLPASLSAGETPQQTFKTSFSSTSDSRVPAQSLDDEGKDERSQKPRDTRGQRDGELLGRDLTYSDRDRTRKRRRGEDDTDLDMRYARQRIERDGSSRRFDGDDDDDDSHGQGGNLRGSGVGERRNGPSRQRRPGRDDADHDAPLVDERGNISLFPSAAAAESESQNPSARSGSKPDQRLHHSSDSRNRDRQQLKNETPSKSNTTSAPYDGTMRFASATADYSRSKLHHLIDRPDQQESVGTDTVDTHNSGFAGGGDDHSSGIGRDAFGNEDPKRKDRDAARRAADDPLAAIQRGVRQVRQVERERKKWADERRVEAEELRREDCERERERESRRRKRGREDGPDERRGAYRKELRREEDDDVDELDLEMAVRGGDEGEGNKEGRQGSRRRHGRYEDDHKRGHDDRRHRHGREDRYRKRDDDGRKDRDRDRHRHRHRSHHSRERENGRRREHE